MGDTDDEILEADLRNGEPDATNDTGAGATASSDEAPVPPDDTDLDQDPSPGSLPSDADVQAERQP
jgi:hypothetical protein